MSAERHHHKTERVSECQASECPPVSWHKDNIGSCWLTSAKGNWLSFHWKGLIGVYLNITSLHPSLKHSPVLCSRCVASLLFHHSESLHLLFSLPLQTLSSNTALHSLYSLESLFKCLFSKSSITTLFTTASPSTPLLPLSSCPKSLPPYNVLSILLYFIISLLHQIGSSI